MKRFIFVLLFWPFMSLGQNSSIIDKLKEHKLTIIEINTVNKEAITSKDYYLKGSIKIYDYLNNKFVELKDSTEIKGRGNSTWELPKKPYRLKTFKSISIGGMPSSKHWALLANFEDKSASRTKLASDLANYLGVSYAPRSIPVELVLNGEHVGAYELIEVIKIDPKRIDITAVNTKNGITSGGVIFELNRRQDEAYNFISNEGVPISIKEPDDLNAKTDEIALKHFNYLVDILNTAEGALYSYDFADTSKGYAKYFNINAAITWYLTEEILKNYDIGDYSVFKYIDTKNKNKITYGPIWDFDLSAGVREGPTGFKAKIENAWMRRFFEDPKFEQLVKNKWSSSRAGLLTNMISSINQNARKLKASQVVNAAIWEGFLRPDDKSFDDDINYLKAWLYERVQWLDAQWSDNPIMYNSIVQDYTATTDEDKIITSRFYASVSKHTNPHFFLVSKPKLGQVKFLNNEGDFIYTPNLNVNGVDTFYYSKGDSTQLVVDSGMVVIQINPINDIPVTKQATLEVFEDNKLVKNVINGMASNTFDADGDALKYLIVDTTKNGKLNYSQDGSFTYSPNKDFNGLDSFTYKAKDNIYSSNISTYVIQVIPVNDIPVTKQVTLEVLEDNKIVKNVINGMASSTFDPDGDTLKYHIVDTTKNGTLNYSQDGSFTYTPNKDFNGLDSFTYKATDNIYTSNISTYSIKVITVNDEPIIIKDTLFYQINSNEIIDFDRKEDFIKNIFDIDNKVEDFDYKFDTQLKYGTVVTGNNKARFYPNNNYAGVAYLNYKVFDQNDYSNTGVIKIRILPDNLKNSFNNILLYPNPSNGRFSIEDFIADNIIILDFSGKKRNNFSFTQDRNRIHINAQSFIKGEYVIYLLYKNKLVAIKRFTIL